MATLCHMEVFQNAEIDLSDMTITEVFPDGIEVHSLKDFLDRWDGVRGISLSIGFGTNMCGKRGDAT